MRLALTFILTFAAANGALAHGSQNITSDTVQNEITACQSGSGQACQNVASLLRDKKRSSEVGLPYNPANALQFAEHGCKLGDIGSCTEAGRILTNGGGKNSDFGLRDDAKGITFLTPACRQGSRSACEMLDAIGAR